jgi:hypothetical protein
VPAQVGSTSAPVVAAARLRKGSTNSARGAARLVTDTLKAARAAGADPTAGSLVLAALRWCRGRIYRAEARGNAPSGIYRCGPTDHPRNPGQDAGRRAIDHPGE